MNERRKMPPLIEFDSAMRNAYLDYAQSVICGRSRIVNSTLSAHAGGPGYKGTAATASVDVALEGASATGLTAAASGDDGDGDSDGDGDGDPDSDRAPRTSHQHSYTSTLQIALNRKRVNVSNRILRMADLKVRIGLSRSTIYEFQNCGQFPRSISLGSRAVGWLESDIEAWLQSRINSPKST